MIPLKEQVVIGLGEVLWDCFEEFSRPGGAPANVAFHAQQLGHRGVICSRVGDDTLGHELLEYLASRNLETVYIQRDEEHPTGQVTVNTDDPSQPSFVIHEDVAWDYLEFDHDLATVAAEASAICFGSLAQRNRQSRETIQRTLAAAKGALIVYDVNLRQEWYAREWIERSLHDSDIVKLNIDEVGVLAELLEVGTKEQAQFGHALIEKYNLRVVCITRSADGCMMIGTDETIDLPGVKITVADAVGAGDAFTAALISAHLRGWPLRTAATLANQVGALVASQPGGMPDVTDELKDLLDGIQR
jgi:fructokinase